jgi:putative acetyltransferase
MVEIRREKPEDIRQIYSVNEQAFEAPEEARIVDALREKCSDTLSLVAEDEGEIVGHIFFSPAEIEWAGTVIKGMGLAPMAVRPDRQNQGIGSDLVKAGLKLIEEKRYPFVIVLGHPGFYPKFGFVPASKYHIKCQWKGIPDEAFMIIINDPSALQGVKGIARYRDEFDEAMKQKEIEPLPA